MDSDKPPLIENHRNNIEFSGTSSKPLCGLRLWCKENEPIPLMRGVGVRDVRLPVQYLLLGVNGKMSA